MKTNLQLEANGIYPRRCKNKITINGSSPDKGPRPLLFLLNLYVKFQVSFGQKLYNSHKVAPYGKTQNRILLQVNLFTQRLELANRFFKLLRTYFYDLYVQTHGKKSSWNVAGKLSIRVTK